MNDSLGLRANIEGERIDGEARFQLPGVPGRYSGDAKDLPSTLFRVVLRSGTREIPLGFVGPGKTGWNWYARFGGTSNYLRGLATPEAAVKDLLWTASGHHQKSTGSFHEGIPVNTSEMRNA